MSLTDISLSVSHVSCATIKINSSSINSSVTVNDISDCLYSLDPSINIVRPTTNKKFFSVEYNGGYKVTSQDLELDVSGDTLTLEEDTSDNVWNIKPEHSGDFSNPSSAQVILRDNDAETMTLKGTSTNRSSGILFIPSGYSCGMLMRNQGSYPQFLTLGFQNAGGEGRWNGDSYGGDAVDIKGNYISIANNSDVRLKTNIIPLHNTLKSINKLNIVQYDKYRTLKRDSTSTFVKCIGVIAQEVEKSTDPILVSSVIPADEDFPYTVDYPQLFTVSIKALQELHKEYKEYKELVSKKIELLEKRLNVLENS